MFLRKPESQSGGPAKMCKGVLTFGEQMPALLEFLTLTVYPDGSVREPSSLIVLIEGGRFKVCLNDRGEGRTLWRTGDTLEDALLSLEEPLQLGEADWRTSRPQQPRGKPK